MILLEAQGVGLGWCWVSLTSYTKQGWHCWSMSCFEQPGSRIQEAHTLATALRAEYEKLSGKCQESIISHYDAKARWWDSGLRGMWDFIAALPQVIHQVMRGTQLHFHTWTLVKKTRMAPRILMAGWTLTNVLVFLVHFCNKYVLNCSLGLGSRSTKGNS